LYEACMAINIPPNKKATFSRGFFVFTGGSGGGRTRDKRIKSPLLYRLSYRPGKPAIIRHCGLPST
jgi:hypothetical protein